MQVTEKIDRYWLPGITIGATRARQPDLYYDWMCFDLVMYYTRLSYMLRIIEIQIWPH